MSMLSMSVQAHVPPSKRSTSHRGVLARFWQRFLDARMSKADEVIKQHTHLLPSELQHLAHSLSARDEASLPFRR